MTVYYFAYGANLSDIELKSYNFEYEWKKFCHLDNYELKLNHISIPFVFPSNFNIIKNKNSKVYGFLYKTDYQNLKKLISKELFYKIIEIDIKIDGKIFKAVSFKSLLTNNYHERIYFNYQKKIYDNLSNQNVPNDYLKKIKNYKLFSYNYLIGFLLLIIFYQIISCK